jgi:hypothetical protein
MLLRIALVVAGLLVALAVVSQLALPSIAEKRIEDRLTAGGGSADVSLSAFPAARLLFSDGDRIAVSGSGLELDLQSEANAFEKLDGFDQVDIHLDDFRAGPFQVRTFALTRDGGAPYRLTTVATTTGAGLGDFAARRVGLPSGPLFRFFEQQIPGAADRIPIRASVQLRSDGGRIVVLSGGATVAGIPTGPLVALITQAIVVRL